MGVEEEIDEECLDRTSVLADTAIVMRARGRVLQSVQRRLVGKQRTARPTRLQTPQHDPQHSVVAQRILVGQVLVAQRNTEHPRTED